MSRFLTLLFLPLFLFGMGENYWQGAKEVELYKDQNYRAKVVHQTEEKYIDFRWTLYKNEGLVCIIRFDGHVNHFILYKDYQRDRYKLYIGAKDGLKTEIEPYVYIFFKEYSRDTNRAKVEFLLRNPNGRFIVDLEPQPI